MSAEGLYLIAVAAIIGCAPAAGTSGAPGTPPPTPKANLLNAEEIATAHADVASAYDAVARLRPNWLAAHGVTSLASNGASTRYALVFVDGQPYGELDSLHSIPAYLVDEFRYYDVTQAGARFGLRAGASGVIQVRMKSP